MSATENSEFAVPEVVAENEKEESKEIKATKRPAEVSTTRNFSFHRISFEIFSFFSSLRIFALSKCSLILKQQKKHTEVFYGSHSKVIVRFSHYSRLTLALSHGRSHSLAQL